MSKENVRHFSINDWAYALSFKESFEFLDNLENFSDLSIEDLMLLFIVTKYENDKNFLKKEAADIISSHLDKIKEAKKCLSSYFEKLDDNKYIDDINKLINTQRVLTHEYIEAISIYGKNNALTNEAVYQSFHNNLIALYVFLKDSKIAKRFVEAIRKYMNKTPDAIEYFVSTFDEVDSGGKNRVKYYIPSYNTNDVNAFIEKYLVWEYANFNILKCLANHKNSKETYEINPVTRKKLKKKLEEETDKLMKNNTVTMSDYEIRIDPSQDEFKVYKNEKGHTLISFSGKWINENRDYPTLLNNLIYMLELVDGNFRFAVLPAVGCGSILVDIFGTKNINQYGNMTFEHLDKTWSICFSAYYQYLLKKEIKLEEIFDWFCSSYMKEEFGIDSFSVSFSDLSTEKYVHRCTNLFGQIERLLKLYKVYSKYGSIDSDIFEEESMAPISSIKSVNGIKYYRRNDESKELMFILNSLFSNQSMLNYINESLRDKTFVDLITKNNIRISDFHKLSQEKIHLLFDYGVIEEKEGFIKIKNISDIKIFNELFKKKYVDVMHLDSSLLSSVNSMKNKSYLVEENTLFSSFEEDYLNYYLNDSKFSNSLGLRNKYAHPEKYSIDDNEAFKDYIYGLKILSLIIIKINDDLCIKFPENYVVRR